MADIAARNKAIEMHNHAMGVVGHDKQLAYRELCSAVTIDPTMAQGWYMMGNACGDMKMMSAAIAAFRRLLQLPIGDQPGDLTPELRAKGMVNLGHRLLNAGEIEEAEKVSREAIAVLEADPSLDQEGRAFAWTNLSLVLSIKGENAESLRYAQEAYRQSQESIIETGLAFALLFNGDYAPGLKHFEARFGYKLPQYLSYPYPRWDGSKTDSVLFVDADQGLGDSTCMARFLPAAAARVKRVVFRIQPELLRLMTGAFRNYENIVVEPQSTIFPIADVWCPVFSLPVSLGLSTYEIETHPQVWRALKSDVPIAGAWKAKGAKLHVGIAYAGSPANDIDMWRSIPVAMFLSLCRVAGVQLYSLQVGDRVADMHAAGMAALCRDLSPYLRDAQDTAAIVRELDLVISIESFLAHLAGAVGKECWTLVSYRGGDWRCGRQGDKPIWYEKTRLFRQGTDGEWGPVFERVVEALREKVHG
jgi:tetratricopeptide (TPR) repeat protein